MDCLRALGARARSGFHAEYQHDGDRRTGFNSDEWARLQFTYQENLTKLRFHIDKVNHRHDHVVGTMSLDRSRGTVLVCTSVVDMHAMPFLRFEFKLRFGY
jgi:hypothetical protein